MEKKRKLLSLDVIEKEKLLGALTKLKPGLSRRFQDDEDRLGDRYLFMGDRIAAYSEDICVTVEFPIGFSGMVKADEFFKLVSNTPADVFQLELKEKQIVVECEGFSFGMTYAESEEFHELVKSLDSDLQWVEFTEEAKRAIVLCSFSTADDQIKPELGGVYVGGGEVLSSDNYRISWYQLGKGMRRSFLVPATSVIHLVDYNLDEYALTDSWVHFKGDGVVYSARLIAEQFKVKQSKGFFPTDEGKGFVLPKGLSKVLDRPLILLQDVSVWDKEVSLTFGKGVLNCEVSRQGLGWVKESIPLEKGPKKLVKVEVNPVFLKEILKHSTRIFIDKNHMSFLSDDRKFRHLIALN